MVCESAVVAAMSGASKMAWMDTTGLANWSSAAASAADKADLAPPQGSDAGRAPTPAVKEMLRLRKKLREISKIEERLAAGQDVDRLQRSKLEKKEQLCEQLEQVEHTVAQEESAAQRARFHEGGPEAWASAEGEREMLRIPPVQMYPLQGGFAQQPQPQQQVGAQDDPWVRFGSVEFAQPPAAAEERAWAEVPVEHREAGAEGARAAEQDSASSQVTTSARRRQRRQRASQRQPEAAVEVEEPAQGEPDCEELTAALEAGGKARAEALERMRGNVLALSFGKQGCRVVQLAVQVGDHAIAGELLSELRNHTQESIASPNANYVLQALIAGLPTANSVFVVNELRGSAAVTARHRFGCRVLCRLMEHCGQNPELEPLKEELLADAEDLCRHSFAHYVMQSMLEHLPEVRARIAQALRTDLAAHARHRWASHVVEASLEHCSEQDRQAFISELLGPGFEALVPLAQSQYGSFVLKAIVRLPGIKAKEAWRHLSEASDLVEASKYGQRLLKDLGLRAAPAA